MKLTIIQTGDVPQALRENFRPYPTMFHAMFDEAGYAFEYEAIRVFDGEPFPDVADMEAVLITGSAAGVYDDYTWMDPLRAFIRGVYANATPMVGICFGHQIMADALGGVVRKSEKGWGLGRHVYGVKTRPYFLVGAGADLAVACSHQDQVIAPPTEADVILGSDFTPNAGLFYKNGAALSFQPHPEFKDSYARALAELRRGKAPDSVVDTALSSLALSSDSRDVAGYIGRFLTDAAA
jgi:GMP synthase-like glutamine amidotransferase